MRELEHVVKLAELNTQVALSNSQLFACFEQSQRALDGRKGAAVMRAHAVLLNRLCMADGGYPTGP